MSDARWPRKCRKYALLLRAFASEENDPKVKRALEDLAANCELEAAGPTDDKNAA